MLRSINIIQKVFVVSNRGFMKGYSEEDIVFLESLMKTGLRSDLCGHINDIRRSIFEETDKGEETTMKKERMDSVEDMNNIGRTKADTGIGSSNEVFHFAPREKVEEAMKIAFKEWAWALEYLRDK